MDKAMGSIPALRELSTCVILVLKRWRQEDQKSKDILCYILDYIKSSGTSLGKRPCFMIKKKKRKGGKRRQEEGFDVISELIH